MAYCPEVLESEAEIQPRRRRHPRQTLRTLAYVTLDEGNGGIIRDLTESGLAIQAVARLRPMQEVNVRFDLLAPRVRVDVRGRVAWADASGQAGIQFFALPPRTERAIRDWLLTQMLVAATISGRDSMFSLIPPAQELTFSEVARPAILIDSASRPQAEAIEQAHVRWGLLLISERKFSIFVDSLVLLCAALLFAISSIAVMGGVPAWPITGALFVTASTIFAAVYQILFSEAVCGTTPGRRLAQLACGQPKADDQDQRFR